MHFINKQFKLNITLFLDKLFERELKISNIDDKAKFLSISTNELKYNSKRLRKKMEGGYGLGSIFFAVVAIVSHCFDTTN